MGADILNLRYIRNKPGILPVYFNLVTIGKICSGFSPPIILTRIKAISPNELLATKFTIQGQKILLTIQENILRKLMNKDNNLDIFHLHALINPFGRSGTQYLQLHYLHRYNKQTALISAKLHGANDLIAFFHTYCIVFQALFIYINSGATFLDYKVTTSGRKGLYYFLHE